MSSSPPAGAKLMGGGFVADEPLTHGDLSSTELRERLRALLHRGLHGVSFSAYMGEQSPERHSVLSEDQVRQRLQLIAPHTRWIRTFSCSDGNEHAPRFAHELGIHTLVGAWIGDDLAKNDAEVEALIQMARAGHVDLAAVGNEVLLRGELPEADIIRYIERVREAVPGLPVAYVDAYYLFAESPRLVEACDFLPINCYPFWEKCPLEHSVGYLKEMVRRVHGASHGKPIVIAETGWPTAGTAEGPAVPSLDNLARYALNLVPWCEAAGLPLFWFSAFDEAWKVGKEGDCGAYWGFWDADGRSKVA